MTALEERRRSVEERRRSVEASKEAVSKTLSISTGRRMSAGGTRRASKMAHSQLLNANFNEELVRTFRRRSSIQASQELSGSRRSSKTRGSVMLDPARRRSWSSSVNKADRQRSKIRRSAAYLEFRKWQTSMPDPLLGRSHRCPFTGRVRIELNRSQIDVSKELLLLQKLEQKQLSKDVQHERRIRAERRRRELERIPDFHLVDLFSEREVVGGLPSELAQELYLMKPKPLMTRTWIFHDIWEESNNEKTRTQCIEEALRVPVVHKRTLTAWQESFSTQATNLSPAVSMLFMIVSLAFTQEFMALLVVDCVLVFSLLVTIGWNNYGHFSYVRPLTALFRYPMYFYLFGATPTPLDFLMREDTIGFFGCLFMFMFIIFEIALDFAVTITWGDRRGFMVVRDLNSTSKSAASTHVYVVKAIPWSKNAQFQPPKMREGHWEHPGGDVDEDISGIPAEEWANDKTCMIVAELHGLICQLLPMTVADYQALTTRQLTGEMLHLEYIQTNTMSPAHYTANEVAKFVEAQKDASGSSQEVFEDAIRDRIARGVTWTILPAPEGRCIRHMLPVKRRRSKEYADGRRHSLGL
ncbi:unnamed protein product [Amoebophrya sp. A25]|nr:unnamed protein product [Amoebophrya sp. A25]|eukprot:GSA25T00001773001.1